MKTNGTRTTHILAASLLGALLLPATAAGADETDHWHFDASLYGLAAGMSGKMGFGPIQSDIDFGFDQILEHLKFGAMGTARVGYDRWVFTTDVIYMHLGATKGPFSADLEQWAVEPTLSYDLCKYFEPLAGMRYNNIAGDLTGPAGRNPTGTQDWYDPIVGANVILPISQSWSFQVRGDIGGFGVGSDFTWQAFPYFDWRFSKLASLQAGYRFLYNDYESGDGLHRFKYDILTSGPQIGFTFHF